MSPIFIKCLNTPQKTLEVTLALNIEVLFGLKPCDWLISIKLDESTQDIWLQELNLTGLIILRLEMGHIMLKLIASDLI
jgi:hypothetical protein